MSFPWSRYFLHCFHHEVQEMYSHCNGRPCVLANVGNQVPDVCVNLLLQSIQKSVICLFIQGWQNDSARVDECGVCKQKWEDNRCRQNSFQNRDWPHETTSFWVLSWVCLAEGMATWLVATTFSRAKEEFLQPLQAKSKSSSESTISMKIHILVVGKSFDCIWHATCNINDECMIYIIHAEVLQIDVYIHTIPSVTICIYPMIAMIISIYIIHPGISRIFTWYSNIACAAKGPEQSRAQFGQCPNNRRGRQVHQCLWSSKIDAQRSLDRNQSSRCIG